MSVPPALSTVDGRLTFADTRRVLVVDPDVDLLTSLLDAWTVAVPRVSVRGEDLPGTGEADVVPGTGEADVDTDPETEAGAGRVPALHVLARKHVLDGVFDDFHAASRGSGLVNANRLSLSVLGSPQPNALVVVDDRTMAVVNAGDGWIPIGETRNPSQRKTGSHHATDAGYSEQLETADSYSIRTPSRRSLYRAFADRCDSTVADDLLTVLDATSPLHRTDPCDQLVRAYLVGARHGVLNYDLRRASEDSGLASPSTLSTVKTALEADGLLETERVPQHRGRPRQRLRTGVDAIENASLQELPELVRELRGQTELGAAHSSELSE